ncbi:hypothetical protein [Neorhizobium sp. IRS_2294]|uniref:hypothetical protein n=1 Tax=unclassified Neorhizobium TaxID=2629175 RepID=UPI003D2C3D2E
MAFIKIGGGAKIENLDVSNNRFVGPGNFIEIDDNAVLINVTADSNIHFTAEALQILKKVKASGQDKQAATAVITRLLGAAADAAAIGVLVAQVWQGL